MNIVKNIKDSIELLGFNNYLLYALDRLLGKLLFNKVRIVKYYFFSQPVKKEPIIKNPEKRNINVYEIFSEDSIIEQFPRPESVIKERFTQNARCFSATKNENVFLGYIWFCENKYIEDEVRANFIPYPQNEAVWDFDVYIKPESRLGLAFPLLWDKVNEYLNEKNYKYSISRISAFNPVSLSVHKKMGAQYLDSATFICIGSMQIFLSSLKPYIHVSYTSYPEVVVRHTI